MSQLCFVGYSTLFAPSKQDIEESIGFSILIDMFWLFALQHWVGTTIAA
jgi:hypothetical protein